MKRKNSAFEKISSGKGFYIAAAVAFCAIIVSIVAVYYTSDRIGQSSEKTSEIITSEFTLPAEVNKTDIPDERDNEADESEETEEYSEEEPEETTQTQTTSAVTQPVTDTPTTQQAQIVNREFILPSGGDIIKEYSAEPVYSETMNDWRIHSGIDFAAEEGDEVYAVGNGKVTRVISDTKWGYVIEIDFGSFTARYCGIDQNTAVGIDKVVKAGDTIGKIAAIPIESQDELHLHFEVIKDGKIVDPIAALGVTA
ncbi:MAG: M23 family metallopeptidase [Faecalibacterium sp.]|nr:M23 family metallopeptidase [Ruminococcus sp.]MCM1392601.1 M23 family metallopeptidase [Ruminococcus sp.]MCM1486534.1 M23 family metallopeptidase [Faecalibacterium sp.]